MAILEKEVELKWSNTNKNHYISKGYIFTKIRDTLVVKVDDLSENSNIKLTKICDECGLPKLTPYYTIMNHRWDDGKDRCHKCGNIKATEIKKNNIKYEKTSEFYFTNNNMTYLIGEFSENNNKKLNQISYGSNDEYLWNCPKCKSEYSMSMKLRSRGSSCPYCRGLRVNHTNSLWATCSDVAKLLTNPQRGHVITKGYDKKESFTCDRCNNKEDKRVKDIVKYGFSCSKCSDGISYPEKFMMNLLDQLSIEHERQKVFEWSKGKIYDEWIVSSNLIIETHGRQHSDKSFETVGGRSLKEEKENDRIKEELAKENGIKHYIAIDCKYSDLNYIKNSIVNSKMSDLFNLEKVDWLKCHEFATKSIVKTICDMWNNKVGSSLEIANLSGLSDATIREYLKKGTKLGWCNYNPKEASRMSKVKVRNIVQLSLEGNLIKYWNSISDASRALRINTNGIGNVCKGTKSYITAGGYKWMYKEDYEEYIEEQNKQIS